MNKKKQVKPEWFDGVIYQDGTTVQNPFTGQKYELNALELSIYDFIMGATMFVEQAFESKVEPDDKVEKITNDLQKGLKWFAENNTEAYMVLLD